jgi:peptidoglycan/LPS O-acetylase OafA/YrhL
VRSQLALVVARYRPSFASNLATIKSRPVPSAGEKYVGELDGIRAIAVSFVVFAHYRLVPYVPGAFGVTLFFFLSGYLITTLFYAEYNETRNINIIQFYQRRWLRLTPPLVIFVIISIVFYPTSRNYVGGTPVPLGTALAALLYYTNYYDLFNKMDPSKVIPFGICWSLAVEEHFYLLWPLILRRNIQRPQRLAFAVAALCVGVLIWRYTARHFLTVSADYTYMATDCRIDSILYGALLRVLFQTSGASAIVGFLSARNCQIFGFIALILTFVIPGADFRETFRYTIQGLALMPIFTVVLTDSPNTLVRKALSSPPVLLIGRLSYSIYLFHLLARTPGEVYFGSPYRAGSVIGGLVVTGAVSYCLFIFVERPIAGLRRRLRAHASPGR